MFTVKSLLKDWVSSRSMKSTFDWLDDRTGYRGLLKEVLFESVPGGARWRYVWGSTLTFGLMVQIITGLVLWAAYSPSSQTAWESVFYIQHEMTGGWLLRGIHHYTAQVMTILLVLHMGQVLIDGAYKAPREVNFWTGLILLLLILSISLTGYLLPWDQKGYWATKVATNLAGVVPVFGEHIQRVIVGGPDYGHHTLTRFFALHAGVLPVLVMMVIVGHIYLFRKHGITPAHPGKKKRRDGWFWPDQIFRDAVACLAVMMVVLILTLRHHGAELTAPSNPAERFPARPDWYFMFLFEFLKYFPGKSLIIGGLILPALAVVGFFAMPIVASKWPWGHKANLIYSGGFLFIFATLTAMAFNHDAKDKEYQFAKKIAQRDAARVMELAQSPEGIPPIGAVELLQNDPYTQGPRIFASKCASCHTYMGHDGMGKPQNEPSAPDLYRFGSRQWLAGFVDPDQIETIKYFHGTAFVEPDENGKKSRMVRFVKDLENLSEEGKAQLSKIVAAVSAQADLSYQEEMDAKDAALIQEGTDLFFEGIEGVDATCADCHGFDGEESEASFTPDLNGWASRQWTIDFTKNPSHPKFYGKNNDRMPVFEEEKIFTDKQIEMVVDWLREDWVRFASGDN
ncbi:MAG: cytochrome b N-terminal domain-containing protein [Verrucomicrobiales bacterium]|nr:cytochrome b N-terminal domain-containing protein [Verrucomicrobiales bacterium]